MLNSALWDTIKQIKSAFKLLKSSITILPGRTGGFNKISLKKPSGG